MNMKDKYGREIRGMRISVTPECNLDCIYCHKEGAEPCSKEMTPVEIERIVKIGREFGVKNVKISGGEPLLRNDLCDIVSRINALGLRVMLTTNGFNLSESINDLANSGLNGINISIHSLNPGTYCKITKNGNLDDVLDGIYSAVSAELFIKLNVVILKGLNDHEIEELIEFSSKTNTSLQLIELLDMDRSIYEKYYMNLDEIEDKLKNRAKKISVRRKMHNRRRYQVNGCEVEVVKPMDNSEFCMHCTRIRLTSDGKLKPCLMRNDNLVDILTPLRNGASDDELAELFKFAVMKREPYFALK